MEEISIGLCILLLILYAAALVRIAQRARARTVETMAAAPTLPEPNGAAMSAGWAIALLAASSLLVALLSDFVADSVDVVKQTLGWTDLFIGVIVVALIALGRRTDGRACRGRQRNRSVLVDALAVIGAALGSGAVQLSVAGMGNDPRLRART